MKKLAAILFIAIYLFNLSGYSFVFRYLIHQAEQDIAQHIDHQQYKEEDLVEFSIPLHLPYSQSSSDFERVEGSTENNGIHYEYVKRKITTDTLYIMCLPNQQKTQLVKDKSVFGNEVNDFAGSKKEKNTDTVKNNCSADYHNRIPQYNIAAIDAIVLEAGNIFSTPLHYTFVNQPERPPQSIA